MQIFIAVIINRAFIPDLHRKKKEEGKRTKCNDSPSDNSFVLENYPLVSFRQRGEESSKASEDAFHVARPTKNSFTWANVGQLTEIMREREVYIPETVVRRHRCRQPRLFHLFPRLFSSRHVDPLRFFFPPFTVNTLAVLIGDDYPRERVARRPERQTQSWPAQCFAPVIRYRILPRGNYSSKS